MNNFNKTKLKIQKVGGREDLLDTCKLYITDISSRKKLQNFTEKGRARSPQTIPK